MRFAEAYEGLIEAALQGRETSPRGMKTFEIVGPAALQTNMRTTVARKGMNVRLGYAESMMIIAGFFDINVIARASKTTNLALWEKQSDYGPRIKAQLPAVIDMLRKDKDSRRAVVYFNSPLPPYDDLACSTALHFLIRNDTLEAIMNVRSWDLVMGMPMDIMSHGILSQVVARCLNVQAGNLYATANSAHVYANSLDKAVALGDLEFVLGPGWPGPGGYWSEYQERARHAVEEFVETGIISPSVLRTTRL